MERMRHIGLLTAMVLGLAATMLLVTCGAAVAKAGGHKTTNKLTTVNLILNFPPSGEMADLYYGKSRGFFAKSGVDLNILPGTTSQEAITEVLQGHALLGTVAVKNIFQSASAGQRSLAIGTRFGAPNEGIFVPNGSPIHNLRGLAGHTIVVADSSLEALLNGVLRGQGINPTTINYEVVSPSALVTAYTSGEGDAMLTSIPLASAAVKARRPGSIINLAKFGMTAPAYAYVAAPKTFNKNRALLERVLRAIYESTVAADKHPIAAAQSEVKQVPALTLATTLATWKSYDTYECSPAARGKAMGYMPASDWLNAGRGFKQIGLIGKNVNLRALFNNALVTGKAAAGVATCPV